MPRVEVQSHYLSDMFELIITENQIWKKLLAGEMAAKFFRF
jgi:hypothetical protein